MKIGVNVLNFGPYATPENLRGWARFVEDTGYHAALISDHVAVTPDVAVPYPAPFYDPFSTLAWFAGMTERIEIGTTVTILPYRSPLETARVAANIDRFSDGRFIFGVGVGWAKQEFEALGVPFAKRGAITDEYLAAIRTLWTQDRASFDGEHVDFRDVSTAPRPVRDPHPPIWVGGNSRAAIRRAARHGTAWHPIKPRIEWLRTTGVPELKANTGDSRPVPSLAPRIEVRLSDTTLDEESREAGHGTLAQVSADLHALQELGAEYVVLDTYREVPVNPESDWRLLETVANDLLDLPNEAVR